ncbi:Putative UbiA family prenyltransferase [Candidatus Bealeia paramacronuclearis]|uniref:UbiA family prenyltransferase n=1 Tax=Candidatus Bealeia paramacronuclearis TaxID=1921001 RepID=A0ABZ2C7M2_9PROT|nr:putative UbiA family prenyltransferase [Candidatus Bealeia paramacronuclearis]
MTPSFPDSFNHLKHLPLVVDLDGTLILRDSLTDLFIDMGKRCPWNFLKIPYWYVRGGRSYVKYHLAKYLKVDPQKLEFHEALLKTLKQEKSQGRYLVLATGANEKIAQDIADHVGCFHAILGSTLNKNLTGLRKAERLIALYGERGFLYAGNARIDQHVWSKSAGIIVVNPGVGVVAIAQKVSELHTIPIHFLDAV